MKIKKKYGLVRDSKLTGLVIFTMSWGKSFSTIISRRTSTGFTTEQVTAWTQFKQTFEEYGAKLPSYPEPRMVMDDPDWQLVHEAAARFVVVFEKKHPEPSVSGK